MEHGGRSSAGIVVRKLYKAFGNQKVLADLDFEVPAYGKKLLVGPSGAGKSTVLRIIAGLDLPDAGEVYLDGELVSTSRWSVEPYRRRLGFVFQQPTLWPHMTIKENILFGLSNLPKPESALRAGELLEKVGMGRVADKYPDQVSGGEAKRAALLRSVAPRPRFLLVDEPFVNLDEATKSILLDFLLALVEEFQMTLLYVTHDAGEVERVGGGIIRLSGEGREG